MERVSGGKDVEAAAPGAATVGPGDEVVLFLERVYAGNGVFHISTVSQKAASFLPY